MPRVATQLRNLNGSVITIESRRAGYAGKYIDAHHSLKAQVTKSGAAVPVWGQWILHHAKDNIIVLESVRYRGSYLDMNTDKTEGDRHVQKVTKSNSVPTTGLFSSWAQFKVWGSSLDNVAFQSMRWSDRWLDTHHSGKLLGTRGPTNSMNANDWSRFKIRSKYY